jgi:hypothetical protein
MPTWRCHLLTEAVGTPMRSVADFMAAVWCGFPA